jgi:hypothetical protein
MVLAIAFLLLISMMISAVLSAVTAYFSYSTRSSFATFPSRRAANPILPARAPWLRHAGS